MKVTIIGSGTCVPRLHRSSCAILVETRQSKVLLDLGMGTVRRLLEYGVSIFDLTHILISHFHPDHTAEWVPLIFATKYPDGKPRRTPLTVLGGTGLKHFYAALQTAYGQWIVLPQDQMTLREIDALAGETLHFDDFTLTARPMNHRPESLAYRVENRQGFSMVYSGDTDECDDLPVLAQDTDLFICESALPDELKASGHLTPALAGSYAQQARAKRLVLTHLYPQCDEVDIVKQAQSYYKGPVFAAEDLMSFLFGEGRGSN